MLVCQQDAGCQCFADRGGAFGLIVQEFEKVELGNECVMSALRGVSPDEAFVLLRTHARDQRLRLSDVALAVLTDPTSVHALTTRL